MSYNINKTAIVDSGFWYALLDERDQHYNIAQNLAENLLNLRYIFPWPILYETLCTRFIRRPMVIRKFEKFLKLPNAVYLDDDKYKKTALEMTLSMPGRNKTCYSLVDNILRMIIEDIDVKVHCIFTFNHRDFYDVCLRHNVEMV